MAIIRPSSDIVTGWTSTGANSYGVIDETTADNADYISANSAGLIVRVGLGSTTDPGVDTGHVLRYRADHDTSDGRGVIARVVQTGSFPFIVTSKQPWRQQPQVPVEIDWSNPLTTGIVGAWGQSGKQLGTNLIGDLSNIGGVTKIACPSGIAFDLNGSSQYLTNTNQTLATTIPLTFFARIHIDSGIERRIFDVSTGTTANDVIGLSIHGSSKILAQHYDGSINAFAEVNVSSYYGKYINICGVFESLSSRKLYIDGVLIASNAISVSAPSGIDRVTIGYAPWSNGEYFDGKIINPVLLNRALSASEVKSLSDNPWQIFRPIKRISYVDLGRKVIAERTPTLTTSPADYTIDLSEAEASGITDYSALAIEVEST